MRDVLKGVALGVFLFAPQFAAAEDAALLIVESDYRWLADVRGAEEAADLAQALEDAGFRVTSSLDQSAEDVWAAVAGFRADAATADRVFVLLSGHMVATARDAFLLTRHAETPSDVSVGGMAVPLGPILDLAGAHPGQAVVMLATSGEKIEGAGLASGAAPVAPQGVTLVSGPLGGLMRVANEVLLVPGARPASQLAKPPRGVTVSGFVSDALPFLPAPAADSGAAPDSEAAFWDAVQEMASVEAYEAYLERYPRGRFAAEARAAIAAVEGDAEAQVIAIEDALGLNHETRRDVQRNLSLLGYDPRGIDGIFGPGSRAAITAWQRAEGYPATGYLTGDQLRRLNTTAEARAAELAAEAEARQAEQERLDAIYWRETGQGSSESGLRSYLARYPDGLFSEIARARLGEIEAAARAESAADEREFWDRVRAEDLPESYRLYLERYPSGAFAEAARARLAELTEEEDRAGEIAAAKAEEARVAGNPVTALLVETRLAALGYDVGQINGSFDRATRRAIRQFQRARDIAVTGYVTRETMVHLLAAR